MLTEVIEDGSGLNRGLLPLRRPLSRAGREDAATILELESAVAAGAGWSAAARAEEKPTMKGKQEPDICHLGKVEEDTFLLYLRSSAILALQGWIWVVYLRIVIEQFFRQLIRPRMQMPLIQIQLYCGLSVLTIIVGVVD